ncbi:MAG TPA: VWA domain-containing protein [Gaiellaceae bacterium]|nr:VWA domain-containing protein [Gaiellaceae bacterium]
MDLGFLTPIAAVIAAAGLIPLALALLNHRRAARVRAVLGLEPAGAGRRLEVPVAIAAISGLLGVAAAQPVVRTEQPRFARRDAQVFVAIDVSRSMLASATSTSPTRLDRAKQAADELRARLADIPVGVATFTDRVLPLLFPTASSEAFDATVARAVGIERPPPRGTAPTVTSFDTLEEIASAGYFTPGTPHRALVVVTDAESVGLYVDGIRNAFATRPRPAVVVLRVGTPREHVFGPDGFPEPDYAPPPDSDRALAEFLRATAGRAFTSGEVGRAARAVRAALGPGPRARLDSVSSRKDLAPYFVIAAVVPLGLVIRRRNL